MIAVDNMILAWGVRGSATKGQEALIERSRRYLARIGEEGKVLAVPTPFLVGLPSELHLRVLSALRKRFVMLDLDANAAARAAEVMSKNLQRVRAEHGTATPGLRQSLKTDALILGVCLSKGIRRVISEDAALRAMAEGFPGLEVLSIPDPPPEQLGLFGSGSPSPTPPTE